MRVFEFFVELCRIRNMKVLAAKGVALFEQVAAAIKECHDYETPEIIQIPIVNGLPEYLSWIRESVNSSERSS